MTDSQVFFRLIPTGHPALVIEPHEANDQYNKFKGVIVCEHCLFLAEEHIDNKCVFDASAYAPMLLESMDARLLWYSDPTAMGGVYVSVYKEPVFLPSFAAIFAGTPQPTPATLFKG